MNKVFWQQKRTQLPILILFNIDFARENKTQTQQTEHSETGIFNSNLDLNTAGENRLRLMQRGSPL